MSHLDSRTRKRLVRATVQVAMAGEHTHERERGLRLFVADAIGKAEKSYREPR